MGYKELASAVLGQAHYDCRYEKMREDEDDLEAFCNSNIMDLCCDISGVDREVFLLSLVSRWNHFAERNGGIL